MTQESTKESKRQLAMVFDLNKCIGCQTCTVSCKQLWTEESGMEYMWWNIVNTVPGKGTPKDWEKMGGGFKNGKLTLGHPPSEEEFGRAWEFNYDEVLYGGKAQKTHLKPMGPKPQWGPNWDEDQGAGEHPNSYFFYLPRICNHCTKPACLEACPIQAIEKREKDGAVIINEDKCVGNRLCQMACPYKRIYFNQKKGGSQKCILCFPRIEKGVAPACIRQCPGRARHFGYLDDQNSQVHKLVKKWKVAIPLHPEFETKPNVFYIPPILPAPFTPDGLPDETKARVPQDYLRSIFGPAVDASLKILKQEKSKRAAGSNSELMDLLISRRWSDMLGSFDRSPTLLDEKG